MVVVLSVAASAVLIHSMAEEQGGCRDMGIKSHLKNPPSLLFCGASRRKLQMWFQQNVRCFVQESFRMSLTISVLLLQLAFQNHVFSELSCLM